MKFLCITVQAVNLKIYLIACASKANLAPSADCNLFQVLKLKMEHFSPILLKILIIRSYIFLTLCNAGLIFIFRLLNFSRLKLSSECQTVWIQTKSNVLSGLIWVQTVCKGYQQTKLAGKELIVINTFKTTFFIVKSTHM